MRAGSCFAAPRQLSASGGEEPEFDFGERWAPARALPQEDLWECARARGHDPLVVRDHVFSGFEGHPKVCQGVDDKVALGFPDPDERGDAAGRVIPHEFVVLGPNAGALLYGRRSSPSPAKCGLGSRSDPGRHDDRATCSINSPIHESGGVGRRHHGTARYLKPIRSPE